MGLLKILTILVRSLQMMAFVVYFIGPSLVAQEQESKTEERSTLHFLISAEGDKLIHKGKYAYYTLSKEVFRRLSQDEYKRAQKSIKAYDLFLGKFILSQVPKPVYQLWRESFLTIRLVEGIGARGFFIPPHEVDKDNLIQFKKEERYVVLNFDLLFSSQFQRLLVHEVFHSIHYLLNPKEVEWVKEGMAVYFEELILKSVNVALVKAAQKSVGISFTNKHNLAKPNEALYGDQYLFFRYLDKNCSKVDKKRELFWLLAQGPNVEFSQIDHALKQFSSKSKKYKKRNCQDLKSLVEKFTVAKAVNRRLYIEDGSYINDFFLVPSGQRYEMDKITTQELFKMRSAKKAYGLGIGHYLDFSALKKSSKSISPEYFLPSSPLLFWAIPLKSMDLPTKIKSPHELEIAKEANDILVLDLSSLPPSDDDRRQHN